jgi:imidazolonepropionase
MATVELLVTGASEIVSPVGDLPRGGEDLGRVSILREGAIACAAGRIVALGPGSELMREHPGAARLDAAGGTVVPGFVDAHTHPVFHGTREDEFERRVAGESYVSIAASGGGILSTVRGLRGASEEELQVRLLARLDRFLQLGTTTLEAKSGYGLTLEDELKSLRVIAAADRDHPIDLVPTFLGAHEFPPEYRDRREDYVELLLEEMLPRVVESGLARYCDVFTESHVFSVEASRRILQRAADLGLGLRLHVDQLSRLGGAQLAAELGAASADHLEHVGAEGIDALATAGVIPVLCPLVPLYLGQQQEAPARAMVRAGLAPALATDFNPGSCFLQSIPEVLSFAALRYGFSAGEALTAATLNAACSLGLGADRGSLEVGKRADLLVLDLPNHKHLTYELGRNPVRAVVKDGKLVHQAPSPRT